MNSPPLLEEKLPRVPWPVVVNHTVARLDPTHGAPGGPLRAALEERDVRDDEGDDKGEGGDKGGEVGGYKGGEREGDT